MALVLIASQSFGQVVDPQGTGLSSVSVTFETPDGSAATTYTSLAYAGASTSPLTTNADGTVPRYIETGTYDMTAVSTTRRVEAVAGNPDGGVRVPWIAAVTDYTATVAALTDDASDDGLELVFDSGQVYTFATAFTATLPGGRVRWRSSGPEPAILRSTINTGIGFTFQGAVTGTTTLAANTPSTAKQITPTSLTGAVRGHLMELRSTKAWYHDPRSPAGLIVDHTGTAQAGSATTITLAAGASSSNELYENRVITLTGGTGSGQAATITAYDGATKIATVAGWAVTPNNTTTYTIGISGNVGVASAGGASTITLSASTTIPGAPYDDQTITIIAGTGVGQARRISSYVDGTRVATVDRAWTTTPDATSRYVIPQAFKGELHFIEDVGGSTVEVQAALSDGYDVVNNAFGDALEEVTVRYANPVRVQLHNLDMEWEPVDGGLSSSFQMLKRKWAVGSGGLDLDGVEMRNVRRTGSQKERCYGLHDGLLTVRSADGMFTGYADQDQCCNFDEIDALRAWGCRRAADAHSTYDVTGEDFPSDHFTVHRLLAFGGGEREDGDAWGPTQAPTSGGELAASVENYGCGTHGPARNTVFDEVVVVEAHAAVLLRGERSWIKNLRVYGKCDYIAKVWFGGDHRIDNVEYHQAASTGEDLLSEFFAEYKSFTADDWNYAMPMYGVEWLKSDSYIGDRGSLRIRDWDVQLRRDLLYLGDAGGTEWSDFTATGCRVTFWPEDSGQAVFFINANNNAALTRFSVDETNRVVVRDGVYKPMRTTMTVDSTSRLRFSDVARVAVNSTNASFTLTPMQSAERTVFTAVLTVGRTVTLATTNVQKGDVFRVTRTAASTGAFNLDFGGLKNLATSQWAEATHDGSAWVLTAFGSL